MSSEFERIGSETLFDGKFISVRRDTFRHEDGEVVHRELVTHPGAVGDRRPRRRRDAVVRPPAPRGDRRARTCSRSPPASSTSKARTRVEAARRELAEEIGKQAAHWDSLGAFYTSAGFADEIIHLFLATGISDVDERPEVEENERIDVEVRPLADLDAILAETRTPRP